MLSIPEMSRLALETKAGVYLSAPHRISRKRYWVSVRTSHIYSDTELINLSASSRYGIQNHDFIGAGTWHCRSYSIEQGQALPEFKNTVLITGHPIWVVDDSLRLYFDLNAGELGNDVVMTNSSTSKITFSPIIKARIEVTPLNVDLDKFLF